VKCIIVGAPHSGKSTLLKYLTDRRNVKSICEVQSHKKYFVRGPGTDNIVGATVLFESRRHRTNSLQCDIIDTPGLQDSIGPSSYQTMAAKILEMLLNCDAIIHVIDAAKVGQFGAKEGLADIDHALYRLIHKGDWGFFRETHKKPGIQKKLKTLLDSTILEIFAGNPANENRSMCRHPEYLIIASKMDLPWAQIGRSEIEEAFEGVKIFSFSSQRHQSLNRVWHMILHSETAN